jgi:hypothetical protein
LNFDLSNSVLNDTQKQQLLELLGRNRDVFATSISELGCTDRYYHHIDTGDASPITQRFYRTSPAMKEEISKQIDELLKENIIEPSFSPWQSPVVMVRKASGGLRFACDYRRINSVTKPLHSPITRLDGIFDSLGHSQAQFYSVLDMSSRFWQIPLGMIPNTKQHL